MADQYTCDMCGKLIIGDPVRYELHIKLFAGYDVLEITEKDLKETDFEREMERLVRRTEGMDPEELEKQVYEEFRYDLCAACRNKYRKDPLFRKEREGGFHEQEAEE